MSAKSVNASMDFETRRVHGEDRESESEYTDAQAKSRRGGAEEEENEKMDDLRYVLKVQGAVGTRRMNLMYYIDDENPSEEISKMMLKEADFYEQIIKKLIAIIVHNEEMKIDTENLEAEAQKKLTRFIAEEISSQIAKMRVRGEAQEKLRDEEKAQEKRKIEANTKKIEKISDEIQQLKEAMTPRSKENLSCDSQQFKEAMTPRSTESTRVLKGTENRQQNVSNSIARSREAKGVTDERAENSEWIEVTGKRKKLGDKKRITKNPSERIEETVNTEYPPVKNLTVIKSNKIKNTEQMIHKVKELVSSGSIRADKIVPIKSGALLEFKTLEDKLEAEIFITVHTDLEKEGYEVRGPREITQAIRLTGVESKIKDGDIVKDIYEKNLKEAMCTREECEDDIRVIRRYQRRDTRNCTVILTVSHKIRRIIMKTGRVHLGRRSCKAENYVDVTICYKCGRLGRHLAKFCEEEEICFTCGNEGHKTRDCENKEAICINCRREKRNEVNHSHKDKECPIYKRELDTQIWKLTRSIREANDEGE